MAIKGVLSLRGRHLFCLQKRWRRKNHISFPERPKGHAMTLGNPTKFRKSRILLIFLHFQRAEHLLVMVGVGNGAQRHGRGKQAKCCALPRPPSCLKWRKRPCRPRTAMKLGAACFGKTEVISHDRLKGACRGESPLCRSFLPKLFWRQKSFGLTGGEG